MKLIKNINFAIYNLLNINLYIVKWINQNVNKQPEKYLVNILFFVLVLNEQNL